MRHHELLPVILRGLVLPVPQRLVLLRDVDGGLVPQKLHLGQVAEVPHQRPTAGLGDVVVVPDLTRLVAVAARRGRNTTRPARIRDIRREGGVRRPHRGVADALAQRRAGEGVAAEAGGDTGRVAPRDRDDRADDQRGDERRRDRERSTRGGAERAGRGARAVRPAVARTHEQRHALRLALRAQERTRRHFVRPRRTHGACASRVGSDEKERWCYGVEHRGFGFARCRKNTFAVL